MRDTERGIDVDVDKGRFRQESRSCLVRVIVLRSKRPKCCPTYTMRRCIVLQL